MGYHVFLTNKELGGAGGGVVYNPNQYGVKGILADSISPKGGPTREERHFEGLARTNDHGLHLTPSQVCSL